METLMTILPIILYILGGILLVTLIILCTKLINSIDRMNAVVDDVEEKVQSLNGFFSAIDFVTDSLAGLSDRVIDIISGTINKLLTNKKKKKTKEETEDEEE